MSDFMSNIAVIFQSNNGHTRKLAQAIHQGASESGECVLVEVGADRQVPWDVLLNAHAIIFGSPTHMGSVSAEFKRFMDETSNFWLNLPWKDKIAAGFTISGSPSGDKFGTLINLMTFAMQHGMIWVGQSELPSRHTSDGLNLNETGSWLGLMASANPDKTKLIFEGDERTAVLFGKRLAQVVGAFKKL